ncbi:hypothetical protein OPV22_034147 [Ensete ventricosum]|uniref:DDE Tnp4 domain-containing protein n=1 Tax=Ensete ventricosum TaxID=4639 RepID=A0AAV8PRN3_ENSVE|nr:hypothetical protein OPV22_034147 [Ensete ventricosum]
MELYLEESLLDDHVPATGDGKPKLFLHRQDCKLLIFRFRCYSHHTLPLSSSHQAKENCHHCATEAWIGFSTSLDSSSFYATEFHMMLPFLVQQDRQFFVLIDCGFIGSRGA